MATWAPQRPIVYAPAGDDIDLFAQKVKAEFEAIYAFINRVRTNDAGQGVSVADVQGYQWKVDASTTPPTVYMYDPEEGTYRKFGQLDDYLGLKPKQIGAIAGQGFSSLTLGALSERPMVGEENAVYVAQDDRTAYLYKGDSWQVLFTLDFERLLSTSHVLRRSDTSDTALPEKVVVSDGLGRIANDTKGNAGKIAHKKVVVATEGLKDGDALFYDEATDSLVNRGGVFKNAQGNLDVNITGSAAKIANIPVKFDGAIEDGQTVVFRVGENAFVNEAKGGGVGGGAGKSLTIKQNDKVLATYTGADTKLVESYTEYARRNSTSYAVGALVRVDSLPKQYLLKCIEAGESAEKEPSILAKGAFHAEVVDGTVKWKVVRNVVSDELATTVASLTAQKAVEDAQGATIHTTYFKAVNVAGAEVTLTRGDDTSATVIVDNVANAVLAKQAETDTKGQALQSYARTIAGMDDVLTITKGDGSVSNIKLGDSYIKDIVEVDGGLELTRGNGVKTRITLTGAAASPKYYAESEPIHTTDQTTLATPEELWINIAGKGYMISESVELDVNFASDWDTGATVRRPTTRYKVGDYITGDTTGNHTAYIYKCTTEGVTSSLTPMLPTTEGATYADGDCVWTAEVNPAYHENRAGKDFYIYLVIDVDTPRYLLSTQRYYPNGYDDETSRKVGGFHCLCASVGTIAGHPLSGYETGDILPDSVWTSHHRPISDPEGMVYVAGLDLWVDIYLNTWTGTTADKTLEVLPRFGATVADGGSTEVFHANKWAQVLGEQKKRLPVSMEFFVFALGSNQGTSIKDAKDWVTAGAHVDTAGRRMISNHGIEDCCGFMWQWGGSDHCGSYTGHDFAEIRGATWYAPNNVLFGGSWGNGGSCGSRASHWGDSGVNVQANCGARAVAVPLHRGT